MEISYKNTIGRAKLNWLNGSGGVKKAAARKAITIAYFLNLLKDWCVTIPTLALMKEQQEVEKLVQKQK